MSATTSSGDRDAATAPPRKGLRLLDFRPIVKGALRGFAAVELPIGLRISGVGVFAGERGAWAALPQKPQLDRDRRQKTGADGKPLYAAALEWRSRELQDRWSDAVVALVREAHPEALP